MTEADILADVVAAGEGDLAPEVARLILRWKFSRRSVSQMNRLAQRNQGGTITAVEREALERYLAGWPGFFCDRNYVGRATASESSESSRASSTLRTGVKKSC